MNQSSKLLLAVVLCVGILSSCSSKEYTPSKPLNSGWKSFREFGQIYFELPNDFDQRIERSDGSLAYINYNDNTIHRKPNDQLVQVYKSTKHNCHQLYNGESAELLSTTFLPAVLSPVIRKDDQKKQEFIMSGKEDLNGPFEEFHAEDFTTECSQSVDPACITKWRKKTEGEPESRYVLCAEHVQSDGKFFAALMTIDQETDNPALANRIFDSFRWHP